VLGQRDTDQSKQSERGAVTDKRAQDDPGGFPQNRWLCYRLRDSPPGRKSETRREQYNEERESEKAGWHPVSGLCAEAARADALTAGRAAVVQVIPVLGALA